MNLRPTVLGSLLVLSLAAPAMAGEKEDSALRATGTLLTSAHDALNRPDSAEALRNVISDAFAFDVWERFLIEGHDDEFTPEQRAEFRALLPGFLAHLYREQFDRGLSGAPTLGDARKVRRDVMVSSQFERANGADLPVEWRLREFPDRGSQVIDVMVAGTSFLLLKRDEFNAILKKGGAPALLDYMRQNAL